MTRNRVSNSGASPSWTATAAFGVVLGFVLCAGAAAVLGIRIPAVPSCPIAAGGEGSGATAASAATPIQHVFILIKENHAFENYFGAMPGVVGYPPTGNFPVGFGSNRTVSPFPIVGTSTTDLPHDHDAELVDLNGGRNDEFVAEAAARGYPDPTAAVGYYTAQQIPQYYAYAHAYALGDRFFSGFLGPTLPNRIFDLAGTNAGVIDDTIPGAPLVAPTILDQLSTAGIPWAYDYLGSPSNLTPLLFASIAGSTCRSHLVVPFTELPGQLGAPSPPNVMFIDPSHDFFGVSEHPAQNVSMGAAWTAGVVNAIFTSPIANSSAVLIFYDEAGGYWDPVAPPVFGAFGDGFRIPFLVLSPFTPKGSVVSTPLDPASVIGFVEANFGLPPLNSRVASANPLSAFFNFSAPPRAPLLLSSPFYFGSTAPPGVASRVTTLSDWAPPHHLHLPPELPYVVWEPAKPSYPSGWLLSTWVTSGFPSTTWSRC